MISTVILLDLLVIGCPIAIASLVGMVYVVIIMGEYLDCQCLDFSFSPLAFH